MPFEKTFFPAVYHRGIIYTFGGYDGYDKVQLNSCEYYDVNSESGITHMPQHLNFIRLDHKHRPVYLMKV